MEVPERFQPVMVQLLEQLIELEKKYGSLPTTILLADKEFIELSQGLDCIMEEVKEQLVYFMKCYKNPPKTKLTTYENYIQLVELAQKHKCKGY